MRKFNFNSLKAISHFFAYRNEVDIYTEDKLGDKEFYRVLFNRLSKKKINDITPLGCKLNVLKAFDNQRKTTRKQLFIVDGDLDLIIDANRKSVDNLVVLDSYCIENYLIDETAALELIYFSNGKDEKTVLSKKLNLTKWLGYNKEHLILLFLNFAILKSIGGGPILKSASKFLTQNRKQTILDVNTINIYSNNIKDEIISLIRKQGINNPEKTYTKKLNKLNEKWASTDDTLLKIVSGKNYLLPLLQHRINFSIGKRKTMFPKESLKLFLANHCDLSRLEFLKAKI